MSNRQPEKITICLSVPSYWGSRNLLGGQNFVDEQGRRAVRLFVKDDTGERHETVLEGDRIGFAGRVRLVAKIFQLPEGPRDPVATLIEDL
ncbi:hypothetical protein ACIRRA_40030 [Nocardia sp. NPDC101769]|uniref:hypothetical protein n=1 Tax=Nocardia sp. NPDC101769 TaxID=3364333 RepID=UPI00380C6B97